MPTTTLSTAEAAYALGVTSRTVCRYARAGKLPAERDARGEFRFDAAKVMAAKRSGLIKPRVVEPAADVIETGPPALGPAPAFLDSPVTPDPAGRALPEWLLVSEAAEMLRVSERIVREQAALGTLPARRYGGHWRVHRSAVEAPPTR